MKNLKTIPSMINDQVIIDRQKLENIEQSLEIALKFDFVILSGPSGEKEYCSKKEFKLKLVETLKARIGELKDNLLTKENFEFHRELNQHKTKADVQKQLLDAQEKKIKESNAARDRAHTRLAYIPAWIKWILIPKEIK